MKKQRHKYNSKIINRTTDNSTTVCVQCGCVRQFVRDVATYFINDTVYHKAPVCGPKATLEGDIEYDGSNPRFINHFKKSTL